MGIFVLVNFVTDLSEQDLVPATELYPGEAKLDPQALGKTVEEQLFSSLGCMPKVLIYTLATIAAQGLPDRVWANATIDHTDQPENWQQDQPEPAETLAQKQTKLDDQHQAIARPESVVEQEFTPLALTDSQLSTANTKLPVKIVVEADLQTHRREEGEKISEQIELFPSSVAREIIPETRENWRVAIANPDTNASLTSPDPKLPSIGLAGKTGETGGKKLNPGNTTETEPKVQNIVVPTISTTVPPDNIAPPETLALAPPHPTTLSSSSLPPASEVEELQRQLRRLQEEKIETKWRTSPALSIVIPTAFGADNNTGFISATYQSRTRFANQDDGGLGIGIGFGDAQKSVGVELSYAIASFGSNRDFGSGGFNLKIHRRFPNDWAVAVGGNGLLNIGDDHDFENSFYGVVSKIIRTRDDINQPFSRIALTAGVGNGQFRTENAVDKDRGNINIFGNIALRVAEPVSLIVEWSGQDLGVGVSIAPFKNIPLVITPALRDITGAGDGTRFVLGMGLAFKL